MTDNHSADEAFDQHMRKVVLLDQPENWSALSFDIVDARAFWRAAWEAKQAADVKAVAEVKESYAAYQLIERVVAERTCDEIKRRITGKKE